MMARILVLAAIFGLALAQATTAPMCNEAMCRSPAIEMSIGAKQAYDCWANGGSEPMTCATGYEAKVVPSVPPLGDIKYYTCCKPGAVAADYAKNNCDPDRTPGSCTSTTGPGAKPGKEGYDCWSSGSGDQATCAQDGAFKFSVQTGAQSGDKRHYMCCQTQSQSGDGTAHTAQLALSVAVSLLVALAAAAM